MMLIGLIIVLVLLAGFWGLFWLTGRLALAQNRAVGPPPAELGGEQLRIPQKDGPEIAAWFVPASGQQDGTQSKGSILLLPGIGSTREEMVDRAPFLSAAGYAVLLIDLQAHGETPGEQITFGYLESRDVHTAVAYLRQRLPGQPLGLIGFSLGGAAALLGEHPAKVDAMIIEFVFSSITQAVKNRLVRRLGLMGQWLSPLLTMQLKPRIGVFAAQLSPLQAIAKVTCPIFVIGGEQDQHTLGWETKALYQRAPEPKQLWLIKGAIHENPHQLAGPEYEQKVLAFFDRSFDS